MTRSLHPVLVLSLALCPVSLFGQTSAPKPDEAGWRKLFDGKSLDGWKAADFTGAGKVHVKDGVVVMEKGTKMTGITYAGKDFPKIDYEVTLEGKKIDGQ